MLRVCCFNAPMTRKERLRTKLVEKRAKSVVALLRELRQLDTVEFCTTSKQIHADLFHAVFVAHDPRLAIFTSHTFRPSPEYGDVVLARSLLLPQKHLFPIPFPQNVQNILSAYLSDNCGSPANTKEHASASLLALKTSCKMCKTVFTFEEEWASCESCAERYHRTCRAGELNLCLRCDPKCAQCGYRVRDVAKRCKGCPRPLHDACGDWCQYCISHQRFGVCNDCHLASPLYGKLDVCHDCVHQCYDCHHHPDRTPCIDCEGATCPSFLCSRPAIGGRICGPCLSVTKCKSCRKELDDMLEPAFQCQRCSSWFHSKCKSLAFTLFPRDNQVDILQLCNDCVKK